MKKQIRKYQMFILNEEIYGVSMQKVKGICSIEEITKRTAKYNRNTLPIIDLRKKLDITEKDYGEKTSVIKVEVEAHGVTGTCGIVVDSVQDIWDIDSKEICEPLPYGTYIEREFLSGMGIVKDEVVTLLNVDNIMPKDEIGKLQDIKINNKPEIESEEINVFDQQWLSIAESLWYAKTPVMCKSMIG